MPTCSSHCSQQFLFSGIFAVSGAAVEKNLREENWDGPYIELFFPSFEKSPTVSSPHVRMMVPKGALEGETKEQESREKVPRGKKNSVWARLQIQ